MDADLRSLLAAAVPAADEAQLDRLEALARDLAAGVARELDEDGEPSIPPREVVDDPACPVHRLMRTPVVAAEADESSGIAARRMREHGISSLVLRDGDRVGIVTDRDLRNRLVAAGLGPDTPVGEIGSWPARTVGPDTPVGEVHARMLVEGIHHVPVVESGQVTGILTATDLLRSASSEPVVARRRIAAAHDVAGLREARADTVRITEALLAAGTSGGALARVLAALTDAVHRRLLTLAVDELGDPPAPFGWLAFGSQGRQEQTLRTDQDTGLLLPDGLDEAAQGWFAELGRWMTDALEAVGFPRCRGGVMASQERWRRSVTDWQERFANWFDVPGPQALMGVDIAFDVRTVAGDLDAEELLGPVIASAADHGIFLGQLARAATRTRPPLGFFGRFLVERSGAHAGTFDVKAGVLLPIADLARLHTLARGGRERTTDDRIRASRAAGQLSDDLAETLLAGYDLALRLRLQAHVDRAARDEELDNQVAPDGLAPFERAHLKATFKALRTGQEAVAERYRTGMLG